MKHIVKTGMKLICLWGVLAIGVLTGQAQDEVGVLSVQAVNDRMGIQWENIQKVREDGTEVVRGLLRPYPEGTAQTAEGSGASLPVLQSNEAAAEVARNLLDKNIPLFVGAMDEQALTHLQFPVAEVIPHENRGALAARGTDYTVVFRQTYYGIPVFEGAFRVGLTKNGDVWLVDNRLRLVHDVLTKPVLDKDQALGMARQHLQDASANSEEAPTLFVYAPTQLVWRMNFLEPNFREVLVDAASGKIVLARKNVRD